MHPASFPTRVFARSLLRSRESARAGDRVAAAPRRDSMKSCINGGPQTVCVCVCVSRIYLPRWIARFLFRNRTYDRRLSMLVEGKRRRGKKGGKKKKRKGKPIEGRN